MICFLLLQIYFYFSTVYINEIVYYVPFSGLASHTHHNYFEIHPSCYIY